MILDTSKRHLGVDIALDVMERPAPYPADAERSAAIHAKRLLEQPAPVSAFGSLGGFQHPTTCRRCKRAGDVFSIDVHGFCEGCSIEDDIGQGERFDAPRAYR